MKQAGVYLVALGLAVAGIFTCGGCATFGPPPACNPVARQCNEADYPPLTEMLPPWPFPRLLMPIEYADAFANAERKKTP